MSSHLREFYSAICALPVRYNGSIATAYDLNALPNQIASADLPARLLLPFEGRSEGRGIKFEGLAKAVVTTADWKLVDLLLVMPIAQGDGVRSIAPTLIDYQVEYLEHLRSNPRPGNHAQITGCQMEVGVFTYPAAARTAYFGVEVTISFKEIVG